MKVVKRIYPIGAIFSLTIVLAFINISCQYDYRSPLPGMIEVRLRTISQNIEITKFTNFIIKVDKIQAIRSDGGILKVFEDAKIIESSNQITTIVVNTLDSLAIKGNVIIGQVYAPPGDYIGCDFQIDPGGTLLLGSNADEQQPVPVVKSANYPAVFHQDISFHVGESQTTKIILVLDLDKSLVKGAYAYIFTPQYEIMIQ
jgi:hypothetical protein